MWKDLNIQKIRKDLNIQKIREDLNIQKIREDMNILELRRTYSPSFPLKAGDTFRKPDPKPPCLEAYTL